MSEPCFFCGDPVNPYDVGTWKRVIGWVHGPRKDAMTLREDVKQYAHNFCVEKAKAGQVSEQPDLLDLASASLVDGGTKEPDPATITLLEEIFGNGKEE